MMNRFRAPEIFLGAFLTVAVFAMGMVFESSHNSSQPYKLNANSPSLSQTHKDTTAEERLADYTLWLAILTGGLVAMAGLQGFFLLRADKTASISAQAASASAEVARSALVASNRAWLTADVRLVEGQDRVIFNKDGAVLPIRIETRNIGNAPAVKVSWHAWLYFEGQRISNPVKEQLEKSNRIRENPFGIGPTIFPQEQFPPPGSDWSYGAGVSWKEINARIGEGRPRAATITLIGCIDYTFSSDVDRHHQTGFILHVTTPGFQIPEIADTNAVVTLPVHSLIKSDYTFGVD
jgi:hypothetical protein